MLYVSNAYIQSGFRFPNIKSFCRIPNSREVEAWRLGPHCVSVGSWLRRLGWELGHSPGHCGLSRQTLASTQLSGTNTDTGATLHTEP